MKITREGVEKVAELARLKLTEEQKEIFTKDFNSILDYFEQLQDINTEKVEPTYQASHTQNMFRDDKVEPSLSLEDSLKNAPDKAKSCFRVPRILE